ncbi:MAG: heme-binding protein [Proteobacteria bacterium]|nr:heme-binding protein [Pseudomonadota bacterium]
MRGLTLDEVSTIVDAALAKANELGLRPVTVAVLDDGGHLKVLNRQEGQGSALHPHIAIGKAWGAVGMGIASRALEQRALERRHFVSALVGAPVGRLVPVAGGVLIREAEGVIIGSVGISGDTSHNDEACAVAGIEGAGFTADTG